MGHRKPSLVVHAQYRRSWTSRHGDRGEDEEGGLLGVLIRYSSQRAVLCQKLPWQPSWRLWIQKIILCRHLVPLTRWGRVVLWVLCCDWRSVHRGARGQEKFQTTLWSFRRRRRFYHTVSGALLGADTWNAPNCTWQRHARTSQVGGFNSTIHHPLGQGPCRSGVQGIIVSFT